MQTQCGYDIINFIIAKSFLTEEFIKNFIRENLVMIDDNCIEYLKKHSIMDI